MRYVLTGGPCGGKTTVLDHIAAQGIKTFPEIASILIARGGEYAIPTVWSQEWQDNLQLGIFREQLALEDKNPIGVFDRGVLDGAAYLEGGLAEFEEKFNILREDAFSRYNAVIHLSSLAHDKAAYNAFRANNACRRETAEEARIADEKTLAVWSEHKNHHIIGGSIEEKIAAVFQIIS